MKKKFLKKLDAFYYLNFNNFNSQVFFICIFFVCIQYVNIHIVPIC